MKTNGVNKSSTIPTTIVTTILSTSISRKMPTGIAQAAIIPIKRAIIDSP
ncbi:MAG: hypothetical protein RR929_02545 [Erysipelotrichaceae bacterium]